MYSQDLSQKITSVKRMQQKRGDCVSAYAKEAIERYIKYYNEKKTKEKLGWMSLVQYRLNTLAA